jgi:hypothetical protein
MAHDVRKVRHAEIHPAVPCSQVTDLGEFLLGPGEADLQSLDLAEPAFAFGFGDPAGQVVADLQQPGSLGGVRPQE